MSFQQVISAAQPTHSLSTDPVVPLLSVMATADRFVKEIFSWITQAEKYADKLKQLAEQLESERRNSFAVRLLPAPALPMGWASLRTAGLPAPLSAVEARYTGTSAGGQFRPGKPEEHFSEEILEEARDILDRNKKTVTRIQELFEELKAEKMRANSLLDPEVFHKGILADVLEALGRRRGLDVSSIVRLPVRLLDTLTSFPDGVDLCGQQLGLPNMMITVCSVLLIFNLATGGSSLDVLARSGCAGFFGGTMLAGAATMTYFRPDAIDRWRDLIENHHMTEARRSLRSRAEEVTRIVRTLREEFSTIEESLQSLVRFKSIIKKENRSNDEKRELIEKAITHTHDPVVRDWLRENVDSDVFFHLVNLACFIQQKLNEEAKEKKKKREDWERRNIELVFLAHGSIDNRMIPATCLLPLMSITDVLLYSPWNCLLAADAAYSIAIGGIQPQHRLFGCANPDLCSFPHEAHVPSSLASNWNSMRNTGTNLVPTIMVAPVGTPGDKAFAAFVSLSTQCGAPGANRYLVPYLIPWIGTVPFYVVTLAISLVLFFSGHEATVHLAACLETLPKGAEMQEEYLKWQYAYTVDHTGMTVPAETLPVRYPPVFNMFKAVFGEVSIS